jgi:hypothetical protein
MQQFGDLAMRISLNLVQFEDPPTPSGQLFDGVTQYNAINRPKEVQIIFPKLALERWRVPRYRLIERKHLWRFTAHLHQHGVRDKEAIRLLGDRKDQRCTVAAAVATEVSGEVGRSVHDNLGGTGR